MAERMLRRARVLSEDLVDIGIANGKITALGPNLSTPAKEGWDLAGRLVIPGFVDAHVHLDKTLSLGRKGLENESGTLLEAIERWGEVKGTFSRADYLERATKAVHLALSHGTTATRTHVDIGPEVKLTGLEALLELKEAVSGKFTLQIVALGHMGLDAEQDELMKAAMDLGADFVGGAPALAPDPDRAVKAALDLAEQSGKPLDLHIDETDDPAMRTLETLADEAIQRGLQGRVTAGHCVSLDAMPKDEAQRIIDKVAQADINIITLPSANLVLQGRSDTNRVRRGLTRVKDLLAAGVNVCAASDNVQDPFNPFGNYDLLWLANLAAHAAHLTGATERRTVWDLVTLNPAKTLGLNYGLRKGCDADFVVLESQEVSASLAQIPPRRAVFKQGTLVAGTADFSPTSLEAS